MGKNNPKRQHFLPQFLLKGFASRIQGDEHYCFLFRKGSEACETNVINVALSKYFYGRPGENQIEHSLAKKEAQYAHLVSKLYRGECGPNEKPPIDEFMSHLIIRTKSIRTSAVDSVEAGLDTVFDEMENPENRSYFERKMIEGALKNPELNRLLGHLPQEARETALKGLFNQLLASTNLFDTAISVMKQGRAQVDLTKAARDGQLQSLEQLDVTLAKRSETLRDMHWFVHQYDEGSLILGDIGPIAQTSTSRNWQQPLLTSDPERICLPISDQHLLVGRKGTISPNFDPEEINVASVELSTELFIASKGTQREIDYCSKMGSRSLLGEPDEMKQIVRQLIQEEEGED